MARTKSVMARSRGVRSRRRQYAGPPARLDIVIPAHNEEHRIDRTLSAYRSACSGDSVRFVVALDRCTDRTADIVRRHMADDVRVELIEFPRLGKGGVLMETFRACDAEFIGFVDADCATPPAEFLRLVEASARADGAIATRNHHASVLPARRKLPRRVASAGFAILVRRLFGLGYTDTQCGAKVLRRSVIERILPLLSSRDFLFDVDLLLTAQHLGFRIVEVPTIWIDRDGSRVSPVAESVRMAASAVRLWMHHKLMPDPRTDADGPVRPTTHRLEHAWTS